MQRIVALGLCLLGLAAAASQKAASPEAKARQMIQAFGPGQDGFELAARLIALGPKILPVVREGIAKPINRPAVPFLMQAEGWLLWNAAPPKERNTELARKVLQGILRCADRAVRYLKVNFDAYCKLGAVGMPPALAEARSLARNVDPNKFPANLTYLVQMLAECGDDSLAGELPKMLFAKPAYQREAAAFILRGIAQRGGKIKVATPGLLRALTDEEERTAKNAAQALYFQKDPAVLKDVFPLLASDRSLTRALAAELVEGLSGHDPGFKADAPREEREKVIAQIRKLLFDRGLLPSAEQSPGAQSQAQSQPAVQVPPIELSTTH